MINTSRPTYSPTIMWSSREQRLCMILVITVFPERSLAYPRHLTPKLVNQVLNCNISSIHVSSILSAFLFMSFLQHTGVMGKAANWGEITASRQSKPLVRTWRSPFPTSKVLLRTMRQAPALDWPDNSQGMLDTGQKRSARNPGTEPFAKKFSDLLSWAERDGSKCCWLINKGDPQSFQHSASFSCQVSTLCPF